MSPASTIASPAVSLLRGIASEPHHGQPSGESALNGQGNNARGTGGVRWLTGRAKARNPQR